VVDESHSLGVLGIMDAVFFYYPHKISKENHGSSLGKQ
jgi:hypothetical protein